MLSAVLSPASYKPAARTEFNVFSEYRGLTNRGYYAVYVFDKAGRWLPACLLQGLFTIKIRRR